MKKSILILGGTTEARQLAERLATRDEYAVTLSLAGRTASPMKQAVPVRTGGFGGVPGLVLYLREHDIGAVIDATHPYAATISANAVQAAALTHAPLMTLRRPAWLGVSGDRWTEVDDAREALRVLGVAPQRVFLAVGRQEITGFASAPQHHYLVRSVDPVEPPLAVPRAHYILGRGPFDEAAERTLLMEHAIDVVVAKNSGGAAMYGKIAAARTLGVRVLMMRRPPQPPGPCVTSVDDAVAWLDHLLDAVIERGV